ncbi:ESPR-type extended signal peptide-containing protein [Ralstonia pseudosolanacearum]|uniref:ESPR-type extended signal peptide-containing protein n=1 Tax=Ralstonia pseudosolanacearum TaxID=1310165 RepID=UPI0026743EE5|nr:ESPR-type extended signal peptide-containing protein [Ralstonia pseudosolanacearum]MDO3523266.1 ESPR-type extended signal peptide-containing protein [Ralstonia pseudosolanacearum]MDO3545930.1 ESPR-type extended signal peptide-containing protein [Ralstonia pseudosolanacearum]MDO3554937.1 ESPR-type extended signal peptide-containing protein [Ralstonia pseudosolanacearum]MDO3566422.1 ESPR-type extended signal peptide-containing protein [Ralstonia pseudosolanacearum]MDO3579864.1 ESPR-type exten
MNGECHRTVFNAAFGMLVAVEESARVAASCPTSDAGNQAPHCCLGVGESATDCNLTKLRQNGVSECLEHNPILELRVPVPTSPANRLDHSPNRLTDWVEHCDVVCG